jgi:hypothetical protein
MSDLRVDWLAICFSLVCTMWQRPNNCRREPLGKFSFFWHDNKTCVGIERKPWKPNLELFILFR